MSAQEENVSFILGKLDGKVDQILAKQDRIETRLDNHGDRLKSLEEARAGTNGFITAARLAYASVAAAAGFLISHIWKV